MFKYQKKWSYRILTMLLAFVIFLSGPFCTLQALVTTDDHTIETIHEGGMLAGSEDELEEEKFTEAENQDELADEISNEVTDEVSNELAGEISDELTDEISEDIDSSSPESALYTEDLPETNGILETDTTPPAFAEDGYPHCKSLVANSRYYLLGFKAIEKSYFYVVMLENDAPVPDKDQVVAGKDGEGQPALIAFNNSSELLSAISISGLAPQNDTKYTFYVLLEDESGNRSELASASFTSGPAVDFIASDYPKVGAIGSDKVEVKIKLQDIAESDKDNVYWVLLPKGAARPNINQVILGTDGNNVSTIFSGRSKLSTGIEETILITGTEENTDYDFYMVVGENYLSTPLVISSDVIHLELKTKTDSEEKMVCELDGVQYEKLHDALDNVDSSGTIKLLKSFTTDQSVIIENKKITLELNDQTLTIDTTDNEGLKVINGTLQLMGEGQLNARGKLYGVWTDRSEVTVTNATALGDESRDGIGVYAKGDSEVRVLGDINAEVGVNLIGDPYDYTQVTVFGEINLAEGTYEDNYVIVGSNYMPKSWGALKRTSELIDDEFLIYTNGFGDSMVSVKVDSPVETRKCAMLDFNDMGFDLLYSELDAALKLAIEGREYEIELLENIDYGKTIETMGCRWQYFLNGYKLNLITNQEIGLNATSDFTVIGPGEFNVTAAKYGVKVVASYANVVVTNATATDKDGVGIYAGTKETRKVNIKALGDVTGKAYGILLNGSENQVLVEGNVYSSEVGVGDENLSASTVIVEGSIYSDPVKYLGLGEIFVRESDGTLDHEFPEMKDYMLYTVKEASYIDLWVRNADFYDLTVVNGFGSGKFAEGIWVPIKANIPVGRMFDMWINDGGGEFGEDDEPWTWFKMPSKDVTVTAVLDGEPFESYLLTVENGIGTGSYAAGSEVTIKANTPAKGKVFDKWICEGDGVFKDANSPNTTFIMPANAVTIKATYKDAPVESYTLTVKDSYANNSGAGKYAPGTKVFIHAGSRSNYSFAGWTSSGDGSFANASSASTTFIMPKGNTTITANWTYKGVDRGSGGSGGGGGASAGPSSPANPTTQVKILEEKKPDQPVTVAALINNTQKDKGEVKTVISDKVITDAINYAQSYAKDQGRTRNGISVELDLSVPKDSSSLTVTHSKSAFDKLVRTGVKSYKISGYPVTISFDEKALEEIKNQSEGDITISIKAVENIAAEAKEFIGIRPVYKIGVSYVKDGKTIMISDLNDGIATISIQYEPSKNETVSYLCGAYVNEKGNTSLIDGANYDINESALKITTSHLLIHGVAYKEPSVKFIDIENHWGKEAIEYVVARGLITGTSETTFEPDMPMTRGILVTALGKLAGVDVNAYDSNSFTDVKDNSPFRPYIEWAYKKGIVGGIGNQKFAPDRVITREEIAVIFQNYAKATGYKLPIIHEATAFVDILNIDSYYQTAITAMHQAGIMMGDTNNRFNPKNIVSRAQVSSMLYRYIKLTIDHDTAYGWTLNDIGQWSYYKNGEKLIGTHTIDGVKYFFNANGILKTGWVKDGTNWRYYLENNAVIGWLDINQKSYYFLEDGLMVSDKWLEIDNDWYYFYNDGSLAKNTKVDGYEIDENGVRKNK